VQPRDPENKLPKNFKVCLCVTIAILLIHPLSFIWRPSPHTLIYCINKFYSIAKDSFLFIQDCFSLKVFLSKPAKRERVWIPELLQEPYHGLGHTPSMIRDVVLIKAETVLK
jgi:hypothetical protein